jgi:hypothetical protein
MLRRVSPPLEGQRLCPGCASWPSSASEGAPDKQASCDITRAADVLSAAAASQMSSYVMDQRSCFSPWNCGDAAECVPMIGWMVASEVVVFSEGHCEASGVDLRACYGRWRM